MVCRICDSQNTKIVLNFGQQPIVHHLVRDKSEKFNTFELSISVCNNCSFLFLTNPINQNILYKNYLTFSSWKNQDHAKKIIDHIWYVFGDDFEIPILEIGSNDGSFLEVLSNSGYKNLTGVEPSEDVFNISKSKKFNVFNNFFSKNIAPFNNLKKKFKTIITRHVLEHVEDLNSFLSDINFVLDDNGILVVEIPDFDGWLENLDYSLWEEHINCFTLDVIKYLFRKHGFAIYHYEKFLFSGRSMTIYAKKDQNTVNSYLTNIDQFKLKKYVDSFVILKDRINEYLSNFDDVSIYGCGGRSSVLANIFDLKIKRFIDDQPEKQNNFTPGKKTPIVKWDDSFKDGLIILGVLFENERKIIEKRQLELNKYFSILPPSTNLPSFWRSLI